ncbi:MAG TPA: DUF481 domain-containing protein, partial [Holophagaceae bacterium]
QGAKRPWSDKASFSYVAVGGNAQSQTLGFSNEFKLTWAQDSLAFNAGGVAARATTTSRSASGPDLAHVTVSESDTTATSAQSLYANLRYDHAYSEHFLWFASAAWDRNVPSGIEQRLITNLGLGGWWIKTDRTHLRTDVGAGHTAIRPVLSTPGFEDSYASWIFGTSLEQKFLSASSFSTSVQVTDSFQDRQDYLAIWQAGLSVAMNSHLALKVGYTLTYKNHPASQAVDVVQTPVAAPPVILGQVAVPLKKADTAFTTSLVLTF